MSSEVTNSTSADMSNETKIDEQPHGQPIIPKYSPEDNTAGDQRNSIQATHPTVVAVCNVLMTDSLGSIKDWHNPVDHVRTRETMEQCISHLILQRRPTANQEWIDKLPQVSKRIEKSLYYGAKSIDEYSDPYTLVNRIQDLVKDLITAAANPHSHRDSMGSPEDSNATGEDGNDDDQDEEGDSEVDQPSHLKVEAAVSVPPAAPPALSLGVSGLSSQISFPPPKADLLQAPLYLAPLKEAEKQVQEQISNNAAAVAATGVLTSSSTGPASPNFLSTLATSRQVSSQGCSRVFIIKVLISVSEFVKGKALPSIFTFKRELVMEWLLAAKRACCQSTIMAEETYYGGPPFVHHDPSTHWSEPHQLYTWWKNNVERRSKFKVLQEDTKYKGLDPKRLQRARWCEAVVALSEVIRASSGSSTASRHAAAAASASSSTSNISVPPSDGIDGSNVAVLPGFTQPTHDSPDIMRRGIEALIHAGIPTFDPHSYPPVGPDDPLRRLMPELFCPPKLAHDVAQVVKGAEPHVQLAQALAQAQSLLPSSSSTTTAPSERKKTASTASLSSIEKRPGAYPEATVPDNATLPEAATASAQGLAQNTSIAPHIAQVVPNSTAGMPVGDANAPLVSDPSIPDAEVRAPAPGLDLAAVALTSHSHPASTDMSAWPNFPASDTSRLPTGAEWYAQTSSATQMASKDRLMARAADVLLNPTGRNNKPPTMFKMPQQSVPAHHLLAHLPQEHMYPLGPSLSYSTQHAEDAGAGSNRPSTESSPRASESSRPPLSTAALATAATTKSYMTSLGQQPDLSSWKPLPGPKFPMPPLLPTSMSSHLIPGTNIPYRNYANTFPVKLFDLVSSEDESVVGWQGHGTAFQVRNMEKFVNEVLPKHFKHNNFTSFQRQLNLYGFRRSASYDKGAYYHPQFQQGQREMAESIRRVLVPHGSRQSEGSSERGSSRRDDPMGGMAMGLSPLGGMSQNSPGQHPYGLGMGMPYLGGMSAGMHGLPPGLNQQHLGLSATSNMQHQLGTQDVPVGESMGEADNSNSAGDIANAMKTNPQDQRDGDSGATSQQHISAWLQSQQQGAPPFYPAGPPGGLPFNSSMYWQAMALNSMGAAGGPGQQGSGMNGLGGMSSPFFMQQNSFLSGGHYPGGPNFNPYGGFPGMDPALAFDPSAPSALNYNNTGPYGVMSHLARNFKMPARGYNRNTKQRMEIGPDGVRRPKLSARDRKLKDMSSAGGDFNAEQYLTASMQSDRYLGGGAGPRRQRSKKGDLQEAEEQEDVAAAAGEGNKLRGRPKGSNKKGRSEGDEATYQDGEGALLLDSTGLSVKGKRGKTQRRRTADDDSISSASVNGTGKGKRLVGSSRTSSYRTLDGQLRSALNRHCNIDHLVDDAEEDLLDLRNPRQRRIHLDFTVPNFSDPQCETVDQDNPDYVVGFYRGELHYGKKDMALHYQLHGSRALPEALLRQVHEQKVAAAAAPRSSALLITQDRTNAPHSTRVGEDYQSDIPALQEAPTGSVRVTRLSEIPGANLMWNPEALSEDCVEAFLELLNARKRLIPLSVGSVLVVHLAAENSYRLCCVLDVYYGDPTPRSVRDQQETPRSVLGPGTVASSVRVFDGYEDYVVSTAECMSFREGEMELALQLLAKHHGELSPELVQEVDWLLQAESVDHRVPTAWSSEEVQLFCSAVKRHGDNIKKVWKLRFQATKKIEEVQEFFLRIYPHTQLGGAKRVVSVYYRGELAAAGYPDGELSANSGSELDEDSVDSVSEESTGSNSDDEAETLTPSEAASGIGQIVAQPIVQGRRGKTPVSSAADPVPAASSSVRKAVSLSALGAVPAVKTTDEPVAVDTTERRSTRKRGTASQVEETLSTASAPIARSRHAPAAEPTSTVPAPAEAVKRRRR